MLGPIAFVGAALIGAIVSCSPLPDGTVEVTVGNHYLLAEGVAFEGDLVHGDRLDIVMVADDDWAATCDDMGGEPIFDPEARPEVAYVCEDVDF